MRRILLLAVLLAGCDHAEGVRAYEEGRFQDALAAFTAAEASDGESAAPELLFNRSLAALRAGSLRIAESTGEKMATRGGPEWFPMRDFLLGSAAFARCERTEFEAGRPEADPTVWARAVAHASSAAEFWEQADAGRDDWPEARRNAERARKKEAELREKLAEAERNRRTRKEQAPRPDPLAAGEGERREEASPVTPQSEPDRFGDRELQAVWDQLGRMQQEKRGVRRARQRFRSASVERDW